MRQHLAALPGAVLLLGCAMPYVQVLPASAEDGASCRWGICKSEATTPAQPRSEKTASGEVSSDLPAATSRNVSQGAGPFSSPVSSPNRGSAMSRELAAATYAVQQLNYQRCQSSVVIGTASEGDCATPILPDSNADAATAEGPAATITPEQAAAIAVARLTLPTVAPGIGPSPNLNQWKMAAVGYPLWLWADGPTRTGPVTDSAGGLSVSLNARVSSLTFKMGDGTTVQCSGQGTEWTRAVKPGSESPTCGHSYTKPSLPAGRYEVTAVASWAVSWTAGGQSGVIDVPVVSTRELPVGELQSVITG